MPQSFQEDTMLSTNRMTVVSNVIAKAERLINLRGRKDRVFGIYQDQDFRICAGRDGDVMRLEIRHDGEDVFNCTWSCPSEPGRLFLDAPGEWKAALLALPLYDA